MRPEVLRLYPLPAQDVSGCGIYEDIELPPSKRRDPTRPYVILNAVASVDGRTAIEGRSGGIGSEVDRRAMRTLRSKVDAVMIGANTLRAERLSLGLDNVGPQPLAVIVTVSGDVPLRRNLIVAEGQEVMVITTHHAPQNLHDQLHARVLRVSATPSGAVDLTESLSFLKAEHAVEHLLVEGGPSLNHALISMSLADELFLTLVPKLLGGTFDKKSLTLLNGPALPPTDMRLISAHAAGGELFLRYALHKLHQ